MGRMKLSLNCMTHQLIEITGEVCLEAEDSTQHEAHPEEVEIEVYQVRIVTP